MPTPISDKSSYSPSASFGRAAGGGVARRGALREPTATTTAVTMKMAQSVQMGAITTVMNTQPPDAQLPSYHIMMHPLPLATTYQLRIYIVARIHGFKPLRAKKFQ